VPAARILPPSTPDELQRLVGRLNHSTNLSLTLVAESLIVDGQSVAATAISGDRAKESSISLHAVAKIFISEPHDGSRSTWAFIFFYLGGRRVAPPGFSHMTFAFDESEGWQKQD
jgi:hypothetical protein